MTIQTFTDHGKTYKINEVTGSVIQYNEAGQETSRVQMDRIELGEWCAMMGFDLKEYLTCTFEGSNGCFTVGKDYEIIHQTKTLWKIRDDHNCLRKIGKKTRRQTGWKEFYAAEFMEQ